MKCFFIFDLNRPPKADGWHTVHPAEALQSKAKRATSCVRIIITRVTCASCCTCTRIARCIDSIQVAALYLDPPPIRFQNRPRKIVRQSADGIRVCHVCHVSAQTGHGLGSGCHNTPTRAPFHGRVPNFAQSRRDRTASLKRKREDAAGRTKSLNPKFESRHASHMFPLVQNHPTHCRVLCDAFIRVQFASLATTSYSSVHVCTHRSQSPRRRDHTSCKQ